MPQLLLRAALVLSLSATLARAQTPDPGAAQPDPPMPDIPTLMHQVELHQRQAEAIQKNYLYREDSTFTELNKDGSVKKVDERAYEIFWIDGVRLTRLVRKDNKDLSADDIQKENDRIDKEVAKAKDRRAKADAEGKETDSDGRDEISVARILELGTFSNPRREIDDGRSTLAIDYNGNPDAKTRNAGENAIKLVAGTVWVDEQDRAIIRAEGHFTDNFKVGAGLLVDIHKGTTFRATSARINDEVWLPSTVDAQGFARAFVFFSLNGTFHLQATDYRKFKASAKILPGVTEAPAAPATPPSNPP